MLQPRPVCFLSTGYTKQYYIKQFAMLVHLKVVSPINRIYRKEKKKLCCSVQGIVPLLMYTVLCTEFYLVTFCP